MELAQVKLKLRKEKNSGSSYKLNYSDNYFILNVTSKKFKKLYNLKIDTYRKYSNEQLKQHIVLEEKYGYDILLHKALEAVKGTQKKHI